MIKLNDKRIVTILLLSLAVNLFLLGMFASRLIGSGPARQHAAEPVNLQWLTGDLGAGQRQALLPELQEMNQALRPARLALIRDQRDVSRELMAEALDREALTEALTALRQSNENYQQAMHRQLVDVLADMPVEQRRRVMQFMTERRPPLRRMRDGDAERRLLDGGRLRDPVDERRSPPPGAEPL